MAMTEDELNSFAERIYLESFSQKFDGWVKWSKRMIHIAGNCRSDGRIALNYYYYIKYGEEETLKILRHELCHLYCFRTIGKHNDSNPFFCELVERTGGLLKGKPLTQRQYIYCCPNCGKEWLFNKRNKKLLSCNDCSKGHFNPEYLISFKGIKKLLLFVILCILQNYIEDILQVIIIL